MTLGTGCAALWSRLRRLRPLAIGYWLLAISSLPARAGIPEPYNLVYGIIEMDGRQVKATNTAVSVEARRIPAGAPIARYLMGSQPSAGDYYALKISLESEGVSDLMRAAETGTTLYITVLDGSRVKNQLELVVGERGTVRRLDFGNVDTDTDGLPDGWEQAYLYGLDYGPNDDPDGDGSDNAQEYRLGTNPLRADARHPGDVDQNWRITIAEVSAYYNSWKKGLAWSISPTNIPIEYVTRATYLWEQGEYYKLDTTITNSGPLWWAPTPPPEGKMVADRRRAVGLASLAEGANSAVALSASDSPPADTNETTGITVTTMAPAHYVPGESLVITNRVQLRANARTFAVEHYPPDGWEVVSIQGGVYDAENRRVKWGPFLDRQGRDLTYTLRPAPGASGPQALTGLASYDGYKVVLQGDSTLIALPEEPGRMVLLPAGRPTQWVLVGQPGKAYTLEASSDLRSWASLFTATAGADGRVEFDDEAVGETMRFYRAKLAEGAK